MNDQRKAIFEAALWSSWAADSVQMRRSPGMRPSTDRGFGQALHPGGIPTRNSGSSSSLQADVDNYFGIQMPIPDWAKEETASPEEEIIDRITKGSRLRAPRNV